jgi:hypothetical protein
MPEKTSVHMDDRSPYVKTVEALRFARMESVLRDASNVEVLASACMDDRSTHVKNAEALRFAYMESNLRDVLTVEAMAFAHMGARSIYVKIAEAVRYANIIDADIDAKYAPTRAIF